MDDYNFSRDEKYAMTPFKLNTATITILLVYTIASRLLPELNNELEYRIFVVAGTIISLLFLNFVRRHIIHAISKHEDRKTEVRNEMPLQLNREVITANLALVFLLVFTTGSFFQPALLNILDIKILSIAIFSLVLMCSIVSERILKLDTLEAAPSYYKLKTETLRYRFFAAFTVLLVAPLYVISTYFFPFLEEKFNTKMLFLGIIGAALFGLLSVSKDVLELFRIISKVKLVATKKISEKITTKATGEIAEIADAFNIVISELEVKMEELNIAKERIEILIMRIGKAITSSKTVEDLLKLILEVSTDVLRAQRGYLYVLDDFTDSYKMTITSSEGDAADHNIAKFQKQMETLVKSKKTFCENNFIAVPLIQKGKVLGVLGLERSSNKQPFSAEEQKLLQSISNQAALAIETSRLEQSQERTHFEILATLALAIEAKDPYTRGHSRRTMLLAKAIAEKLQMPEEVVHIIRDAALLHDIGKVGIPDSILIKSKSLTPDEYEIVKKHPIVGANILKPLRTMDKLLPGIRSHHEKPNGEGYPEQLTESKIDPSALIVGLADAVDAMLSNRPYRSPLSIEVVAKTIKDGLGTIFEKKAGEAFLQLIEQKEFNFKSLYETQ